MCRAMETSLLFHAQPLQVTEDVFFLFGKDLSRLCSMLPSLLFLSLSKHTDII